MCVASIILKYSRVINGDTNTIVSSSDSGHKVAGIYAEMFIEMFATIRYEECHGQSMDYKSAISAM